LKTTKYIFRHCRFNKEETLTEQDPHPARARPALE
jgi:hypothetical protein